MSTRPLLLSLTTAALLGFVAGYAVRAVEIDGKVGKP